MTTEIAQHPAETTGATESPETVKTAEQIAAETAALHTNIKANFDNKVDIKETKFFFRKVKDEATGLESKRPTVELSIPVPSVEGIIAIIEAGGKGLDLLLEACAEVVITQAREIVNADEKISQESLDLSKLSWEHIANLPKAERRGGGISKDVWEEFAKDYVAVMPQATGKSVEQVTNASKILLTKFSQVKTNKPVLDMLKGQLAIYLNASQQAETYAECVQFLTEKADTLLKMDDAALLANL